MPPETLFHGAAVVAVKHQTTAQNKELIYELWKGGPLSRSRFLLLVNERTHAPSISNNWWNMVNGLKTPRIYSAGGRTAIDATRITAEPLVAEDPQTTALLQQRKDEYRLW
jgi:4-hydroxy-3-polyprenylbenzoate decarboxylase